MKKLLKTGIDISSHIKPSIRIHVLSIHTTVLNRLCVWKVTPFQTLHGPHSLTQSAFFSSSRSVLGSSLFSIS